MEKGQISIPIFTSFQLDNIVSHSYNSQIYLSTMEPEFYSAKYCQHDGVQVMCYLYFCKKYSADFFKIKF